MEIVNLNKQVYNKNQYVKVINTSFTQLIPTPVIEPALIVPTLQDFFNNYNSLFFQIPKFGDTNSHQYIINTSSNYIGENQDNETIQALIDEITQLREENLNLQQQLFAI
jgi:hypothetical protein